MTEQRMVPVELLNDCLREAGYAENFSLVARIRAIIAATSAPAQAMHKATNAQLIEMSELLSEAAKCLRKVQDDDMAAAWDKFAIRDLLPDELEGSAVMLAALKQEASCND